MAKITAASSFRLDTSDPTKMGSFFPDDYQIVYGTNIISLSDPQHTLELKVQDLIEFPLSGSVTGFTYYNIDYKPLLTVTEVAKINLVSVVQTAAAGEFGAVVALALGGNDTINASAKADTVSGFGGNDVIDGKAGNDTLWGDKGNDTLVGGDGKDTLSGDAGRDLLSANAKASTASDGDRDTFRFKLASDSSTDPATYDQLWGSFSGKATFKSNGSTDVIDLSAIDTNGSTAGGTGTAAFHLVTKFSAKGTGEVLITKQGHDFLVSVDTDKDSAAETSFLVHSSTGLGAGDFIL